MPVEPLDNYLNVTLLNSNPILHTSRLFSIFRDYLNGVDEYESIPLFYEEWSIESSDLLIKMDRELFEMLAVLNKNGICVNQITTLLAHYESNDSISMTNKINSINSLKGLSTPAIKNQKGMFVPDLSSRYFTADFPYGLDILLSFSRILNVKASNMEMVSNWYHKISKTKRVFKLNNFGINSIDDLKNIYSK